MHLQVSEGSEQELRNVMATYSAYKEIVDYCQVRSTSPLLYSSYITIVPPPAAPGLRAGGGGGGGGVQGDGQADARQD